MGRRRATLSVTAAAVIVCGLLVHAFAPDGFLSDAAGDALYAVLIHLLVAFAAPGLRPCKAGAIALAWCTAVELFQLTGLPELWGSAFRPLMLVFGTVFSPWDLLFYAVGVAVAAAIDSVVTARLRAPGPRPTAARESR
jgi:hypothetical protein